MDDKELLQLLQQDTALDRILLRLAAAKEAANKGPAPGSSPLGWDGMEWDDDVS